MKLSRSRVFAALAFSVPIFLLAACKHAETPTTQAPGRDPASAEAYENDRAWYRLSSLLVMNGGDQREISKNLTYFKQSFQNIKAIADDRTKTSAMKGSQILALIKKDKFADHIAANAGVIPKSLIKYVTGSLTKTESHAHSAIGFGKHKMEARGQFEMKEISDSADTALGRLSMLDIGHT